MRVHAATNGERTKRSATGTYHPRSQPLKAGQLVTQAPPGVPPKWDELLFTPHG
jgi:hypothetical protein